MAQVNQDNTIESLEIRDTNAHNGTIIDLHDFQLKTIIIENSLDEDVSLQCQACAEADFVKSFNVGPAFLVTAGTNTYQTCDSFFPYMRMAVTCSTAPTTGDLTVHLVQYGV